MKTLLTTLLLLLFHAVIIFAQCNNLHFQPVDCDTYEPVISTVTPLDDRCEKWPAPLFNNDPHIAKYQNQLTINYPAGPDKCIQFSANDAQYLMDWARAHWSLQCSTPRGLAWQTTTTGGTFYWETDPSQISYGAIGETFAALDPNDITIIVDASDCMPNKSPISKIAFNNSDHFYREFPEFRWTTTPNGCNGTPYECLDFQSVALHELGHYLGLAHDGSATSVMAQYYRGRMIDFEMCDVDRFRRLYCIASVGNPVGVKEPMKPESIGLEIFPNPVNQNYIKLKFNLEKPEYIHIYLSDLTGKEIAWIANEFYLSGIRELTYPVFDIPAGIYFVNFAFSNKIISNKISIYK